MSLFLEKRMLKQGAAVTAAANVNFPTFCSFCTMLTGSLLNIVLRVLKENLEILAVRVAG